MPVRGRTRPTVLVVVVVVSALLTCVSTIARPDHAAAAPGAPASTVVAYRPPVDAPVTDPFRPPANPWEPGNRGIEYGTAAGNVVEAAADGDVTFAGPVAGVLWVTLGHADGVRTTYGPLASVAVAQGMTVTQGENVGTTAGRLLFTARQNGEYIDPNALLAAGAVVRLLPTTPHIGSGSSWDFGAALDAVESTLEWVHNAQPNEVLAVAAVNAITFEVHVAQDVDRWRRKSDPCSDSTAPPAPPPTSRRAAILVGGLGSSSENASVDHVPTATLGYATSDVMRFSYRGGRTPTDPSSGRGELASIPSSAYAAVDTLGDLREAGERLAALIIAAAAALPVGVPIDVIAHSQGGLVTRVALAIVAERRPDLVPRLGVVATIATPHHGAPLASIVSRMADDPVTAPSVQTLRDVLGENVDPDSTAVHELAPGSSFLDQLDQTPLPAGVHVLSIGARGDVVVPLPTTELDGADHATVSLAGITAHDAITSSDGVRRELALAIAGQPPSCDDLFDAITDSLTGRGIEAVEGTIAGLGP